MRSVLVILGIAVAAAGIFFLGYIPHMQRANAVEAATKEISGSAPRVLVTEVKRAKNEEVLELPGTLDSRRETPIYARAEGYIKKRYVGFGDLVKEGQVLVEIDAPEVERQYETAKAQLAQRRAALVQAEAAKAQALANRKIAEATNERWRQLVAQGVISKQDGDEKQAALEARVADVSAAEANIAAAKENITAAEAELNRLAEVKKFEKVVAPFDGVITARSCEVGNLITPSAIASGKELFAMAQVNNLRILLDLPEVYVPRVAVNQPAVLDVAPFPAEEFHGRVSRLSNSVKEGSQTMTIEILVDDKSNRLRPGMFTKVKLVGTRRLPPLEVPGDSLVSRNDGTYVALLLPNSKVHFQKVQLGRDFGGTTEILSGLREQDKVILSPNDDIREGVTVKPVR